MHYYFHVLKNYAVFSGRAHRKEFWTFTFINIIITMAAFALDRAFNLNTGIGGIGVIQGLYDLVVLIPHLAVSVRRLHDIGKSGWFFLIILFPFFIGCLWLIKWFCTDSEPGINQYGQNPKQTDTYQTDFA